MKNNDDHQKSGSRRIPSGNALIHCEISGCEHAPAIIFLHGNGEDLHVFDPQIRYFSQYYRTIAVDTRAHGQSTRGTEPFNFHAFAADLLVVLDALHIEKAHITGFSDGAIIALHAALIAPERVASMVLLGANYNPKGLRRIPRLQIWWVYAWLSTASFFSAKMRQRKEIWGLMVHQPNLTIAELSRIAVPTLVVTGENDMVSQRHNDEISHAIAGAKRLIIPGGDHFWMFAKPGTLNHCIMEFLQNN
jgi:pimeloyl-ACP methyl ester carboxylesterase